MLECLPGVGGCEFEFGLLHFGHMLQTITLLDTVHNVNYKRVYIPLFSVCDILVYLINFKDLLNM